MIFYQHRANIGNYRAPTGQGPIRLDDGFWEGMDPIPIVLRPHVWPKLVNLTVKNRGGSHSIIVIVQIFGVIKLSRDFHYPILWEVVCC